MTLPIRPLPTPPTRRDPTSFYDRADNFVAALPAMTEDVNEAITAVNTAVGNAKGSADASAASAAAAAKSAQQAEAGIKTLLERMPDSEAILKALTGNKTVLPPTIVGATACNAIAHGHYVLTADAATTVTGPAQAATGDVLWISAANMRPDNVFNGGGHKVMGLDEAMQLDMGGITYRFVYLDATRGWWIA